MRGRPGGFGDPLLRWALHALPAPFRAHYADEILSFHHERLRHVRASRWARFVVWCGAVRDVLWNGVLERAAAGDEGRKRSASRAGGVASGKPPRERFSHLARETRVAVRGLVKSPGFAAAFVLTIGLGIGANTAIFSVVRGVLLRPLPHEGGDRIVYLRQDMAESAIPNVTFSVPEIRDYREATQTLTGIAEFSALTFTMLSEGEPRRVRAAIVSGNYFDVMGLDPVIGRALAASDDPESADPVMMLTHDFWLRAFGGDSSVVGRTVQMSGRTIDIIGVLEPVPDYPERIDVFVNTVSSPHHMSAAMGFDREHRMTQVFARLAPGYTVDAVDVELDGVAQRLMDEYPETFIEGARAGVTVTPLKDALTSRARLTLLVLLGAAGFVLVIACANVANLTLTRGIRRERELAVRAVLGAGKATLRRLLLIENAILSLLGAALGLVFAVAGIDLLISYAARFTPRASEIAIDGWVLTFTLAVAIGAAILLAFVPPLPAQGKLGAAIARASTRSTGGTAGRQLQQGLVVAQLAVSFVLLIGAGLLLKTLLNLQSIDPGFDVENVLTMEVPAGGLGRSNRETVTFYDNVNRQIAALPGVTSSAVSSMVPLSATPFMFGVAVEGLQVDPGVIPPLANYRAVSPDYFRTVGTPVMNGRAFAATDHADAGKVVVINQSMADYYYPGQDPVGRRLRWDDPQFQFIGVSDEWRTIVGVVADTRDFGLDALPAHSVFQPMAQEVWVTALLIRTAGSPAAIGPSVAKIIRDLDGNQPIENIRTLADIRASDTAPKRLNASLVGSFAVLAMLIAAVGVSGVLAFSVSQRTNEFGIRLTLGADQQRVLSMVLKEGAVLLGIGLIVGGAAAFAVSRFLSGMLFGVEATDPLTFVIVGSILAAVAIGASWLPAWRASRVEPVEALRG